MKCRKCECWNKGVPSTFKEDAEKRGIMVGKDKWGFCDLCDDVMFADEGCEATETEKAKRVPLVIR